MNFLWMAGLLASSVAIIVIAILTARRRSRPHPNVPTEQLGTVRQQWLTAHRAER